MRPLVKSVELKAFARALSAALQKPSTHTLKMSDGQAPEKVLKRGLIEKQVERVWHNYPGLLVCTPPWNDKGSPVRRLCAWHLKQAHMQGTLVKIGCKDCWTDSKEWASVDAWGMRHNFDIVVNDRDRTEALVIEVKAFRGARSPNSEVQRFIGQLLLARSKHPIVMGICGRWKAANMGLFKDTAKVDRLCRQLGLEMVFLEIRGAQ
jgi:hypothetical protein